LRLLGLGIQRKHHNNFLNGYVILNHFNAFTRNLQKTPSWEEREEKALINGRPWWIGGCDNHGTTLGTNLNETIVEANLGGEKLQWVGEHDGHNITLGMNLNEIAANANLGGSNKYSNENFED
jgi:hypothetical protein